MIAFLRTFHCFRMAISCLFIGELGAHIYDLFVFHMSFLIFSTFIVFLQDSCFPHLFAIRQILIGTYSTWADVRYI